MKKIKRALALVLAFACVMSVAAVGAPMAGATTAQPDGTNNIESYDTQADPTQTLDDKGTSNASLETTDADTDLPPADFGPASHDLVQAYEQQSVPCDLDPGCRYLKAESADLS